MLRKILLGVAALCLLAQVPALAKKEKTGVVEKDLFTDSMRAYQFTVPYNWKAKAEKEPSLLRVTLQKTKLEPLPAGGSRGSYDTDRYSPQIIILADTTSLSVEEFADKLVAAKGQLSREKEYLMKLDLVMQSHPEQKIRFKAGNLDGLKFSFQRKYFREVSDPREKPFGLTAPVTIEEALVGHLYVFKRNNSIYIIQCQGERATYQFEEKEYQKLLESWNFIG